MKFFNWIFGNKKKKMEHHENDGTKILNTNSEEKKEFAANNSQNTNFDSSSVKRIKIVLEPDDSNMVLDPSTHVITLESMLNDKLFSKDSPELYEAFLSELKIREPEIFKNRFGEGNDDWKTLNNIYPIIKNRAELKSLIEWENGQIKPGSAMDGLVVIELFDDILLTFWLENGSKVYEMLKITHFSDFERLGTNQIVTNAYLNLERKIKDTISMDIYPSGIGMLIYCGGIESSLITEERVWNQIQGAINSKEIVFSIPTQDIFIFCDKKSTESIELLKANTFNTFMDPSLPGKISSKLYFRNEFGSVSVFVMDYYPLPKE